MVQPKEITGLDCEADILDSAGEILRVRFEEVLEKRAAVADKTDVEAVHDMRVAIRRLRSAIRDFSPLLVKKKSLAKAKRDLKRLADALGAVRDEDVAIIALEKLGKKNDQENIKNGIDKLIERRSERREKARSDLLETFSAISFEKLIERFEEITGDGIKTKKSGRAISFNETGRTVIGKSIEEFCALSHHIYEPFIDKPLHEFRIAAKRLRYGIELYKACWGETITPFAEQVAGMQSYLGEVHDADLWLENLSKKLKKNKTENPANIWLLSEFVKKRVKNYRAALNLWSDWKETDFIENLKVAVSQKTQF